MDTMRLYGKEITPGKTTATTYERDWVSLEYRKEKPFEGYHIVFYKQDKSESTLYPCALAHSEMVATISGLKLAKENENFK